MTGSSPPAERYERLLEVQTIMARVTREIGPALDLDRVLEIILDAVRSLVDCEGGAIVLVHGDHYDVAAVTPADHLARVVPEVVLTGESLVEDGFLSVPLVCLGDVIGTVNVYASAPDAFSDEHRVLLEGLATQVAGAVESARRYQMISELEVLKSDFIARVSHELRTPITIMSGFVSTLLADNGGLDDEARRKMLERVDVATARLSGLIDQLLMLSRLEAGVVAATIEPIDAIVALEEVRRQSITPDTVEIVCPEGLRLITDRALLVRALGFLVDNALKYAGSCRLVGSEGVIEVIDNGPGIPSHERSRVFERFTRANADTTIPGMGIGLPMARTLLAAAGAELRIEDVDGGFGCRMVARWEE